MKLRLHPMISLLSLALTIISGCSGNDEPEETVSTGELITRKSNEYLFIPPPKKNPSPQYPWEEHRIANIPRITKEFFRCKGTYLNPEKIIERSGKPETITDCGGVDRHSLPLCDSKEFIYQILITLLNHLQTKTKKRVIITSGHRCPEHNTYVDSSVKNSYSKHMIGAEVSFFVQGMEDRPQDIINILLDYYKFISPFQDRSEFSNFNRYEKSDTNVSVKPWYNKEVFIKLFKRNEGRNFDNRHPYPYISIQVRYDTEKNENVSYSWDKAYKNYLRR